LATLLLYEKRATLFAGGQTQTATLPLRWYEHIEKVRQVLRDPLQGLLSGLRVPANAFLRVYVFPEVFQAFSSVSEYHNPSRQDIEALARQEFARFFPGTSPDELRVGYSFGVEGTYIAVVRGALLDALAGIGPNTKGFYSGTLSLAESLARSIPPGVARAFVFYIEGGTALGVYIVRSQVYRIVRLSSLEALSPGERLPEAQVREYAQSLEQELDFLATSPERVQFYVAGAWSELVLGELGFSERVIPLSEEDIWGRFDPGQNLLYGTYTSRKGVQGRGRLPGYFLGAFVALLTLAGGARYLYLSNQLKVLQDEVEELQRTRREGLLLQKKIEEGRKQNASLEQAIEVLNAYPIPDALLVRLILALKDLPPDAKVERVSLGLEGGSLTLLYNESLPPSPSVIVQAFEGRGFKDIKVQAIDGSKEGPGRVIVSLPPILPLSPNPAPIEPATSPGDPGEGMGFPEEGIRP